jgi:hypothetical protein
MVRHLVSLISLVLVWPWSPVLLPAAALDVILVRHADKDVRRGDYNLTPIGFQRAIALASLIPACFGAPSRIIAFYIDPITMKNARSYQSAVPLAVATGLNIMIDQASRMNSFEQGQMIRNTATAGSERVVMFWEHRRIPELARGLGLDGLPEIANDDFDQLLLFRFAGPGAVPQVQRYSQRELFQRPCYRQAPGLLPDGPITPPIPSPVTSVISAPL